VSKFRRFIFLALIFCIPLQGFAASGGKLCAMGHAAIRMVAQVASSAHSMKNEQMTHHVINQALLEKTPDPQAKSIKVSKCALCAVCCGIALLPEVSIVLPLVAAPNFAPIGKLLATAEFLTSGLERPPRSFLS
jgi:hypothetical protein